MNTTKSTISSRTAHVAPDPKKEAPLPDSLPKEEDSILSKVDFTVWDERWKKGETSWDLGVPHPAIAWLNSRHPDWWPSHGRILVPGCGSGYDCHALASKNIQVVGLDFSVTAVKQAQEILKKTAIPEGSVKFIQGDFFQHDEQYELVLDSVFLCALQPILRPLWAAKLAELVLPEGILVYMIFPIAEHSFGPPFAVTPESIEMLLSPYFSKVTIEVCPTHPLREGYEKLSVWKRKKVDKEIEKESAPTNSKYAKQ